MNYMNYVNIFGIIRPYEGFSTEKSLSLVNQTKISTENLRFPYDPYNIDNMIPASMTTFQVHFNFLTSARTFQLQRNFPTAGNFFNFKRNFPTSLGSFQLCSVLSNYARFFPTAISNYMYPKIRCQDFKLKWTIRNKKSKRSKKQN